MPRPGAGGQAAAVPQADLADALLPDDAEIDVAAVRDELGIDLALDGLDRLLVGLAPVKGRLRDLAALLLIDQLRSRFGITSSRPSLHMCFAGPPGTGKTTVATKMGEILHALGYLPSGHLVTVTRDDLVGQYIGHTAPKTREVLKRAMGGVLFIDEAYSLHRQENERDYGQEAIEMLLQVMEDDRDRIVVILAGYADRMDQFFASNPGLRSRIAHHLDFPGYSLDELVEIGRRMMDEQGYELAPSAEPAFRAYVELRMAQPHFANARSVRNAIDRARLRQAARLVASSRAIGRGDLRRLEAGDLLASRVFDGAAAGTTQLLGDDGDDGDGSAI